MAHSAKTTVYLNQKYLAANRDKIFAHATSVRKQSISVTLIENNSRDAIPFDTVLKNDRRESRSNSIGAGNVAVIQAGGEIHTVPDGTYKKVGEIDDVSTETADNSKKKLIRQRSLGYMRSASISDADINQCTLYRAESIERVDKYIRLPNDEHGNQVNYVIMQPWGENNNLVEQKAKSGDILVFNPDDSIYFNSGDAGTLDTFVNAETGEPLKVELVSIVSLTTLLEQKHEEKSSSKGTTSPQVAMESREFSNPSRKLHEISKDPEALTPQDTDPSINTIKHI